MFVECKEGSEEQLKIINSSNVVFEETTSDLYYLLKDVYCKFREGFYVSKTDLMKTFSTKDKVSIIISGGICTNFEMNTEMNTTKSNRKPHSIGNGKYKVLYKEPYDNKCNKFIGICENFGGGGGKSAFWDIENEQMLLVEYEDIIGLYPIEG